MKKHTFTDAEAQHLLAGATPEGRPELAELAASIADVRRMSRRVAPQPSAALAAQLERPTLVTSGGAEPKPAKGIRKMFETIAGLGIAAKVAAATGVLALGLTGIGAAGALPGPAQDAFDRVVSSLVPTEDASVNPDTDENADEGASDPVGSKEFGTWVQQGAQDPNKVGSEFGADVSEQAQELKGENADERANIPDPASGGLGGGDGDATDGDETTGENPTDNGKPAETPGGRP